MSGKYWIVFGIVSLTAFNMGCSFSAKSAADGSYQPGLELPGDFTKTWSVGSGTSSDYTTSGADVIYTASTAELRPLSTDQSDDVTIGFGAGTPVNMEWDGSGSALRLTDPNNNVGSGQGDFLSRVFTANSSIDWTQLTWTSDVPAGKPLPNNKGIETSYTAGNADMSGNVLLYHMDETSWNHTAGEVKDSSGGNLHGTTAGAVSTTTDGRFGGAANFTSGSNEYIQIADDGNNFGISDKVTMELWVNLNIAANDKYRGLVVKRLNNQASTNFGLSYVPVGGLSVEFALEAPPNNGARFQTGIILNNGEWYHIVATFDNTISGERLKVYVNGELRIGTPGSESGEENIIKAASGIPLNIGILDSSFGDSFVGKIDEVALYNRVLSEDEVVDHYNRGAKRLKFQVKTSAGFVGPDKTGLTYFTEGTNTDISNITAVTLPTGMPGSTFQYKAIMENDDGVQTPLLKSVSVTPTVYSVTKPNLAPQTGTAYKTLRSFAATTGGAGTVKFQLIKDASSAYYWDGSQWTAATLSSHTNTAAEINTNIATFPTEIGTGTLRFKAFFDSGDGSEKPTLTSVTVEGDR